MTGQKKRKFVARRYTEYIVQSYVMNEKGEWEYETNIDVVRPFKAAQALIRFLKTLTEEELWDEHRRRNR